MQNKELKPEKRVAHCLCGAVKIIPKSFNKKIGSCHCGMCRRWCSGPYIEVDCGTDVVIEGEENITIYDSSPWAERGFCNKCGSNLFYRLKETGGYQVAAGLFENDEDFVLDLQVFIDKKPKYYNFAQGTNEMTEKEIFDKYAPSE